MEVSTVRQHILDSQSPSLLYDCCTHQNPYVRMNVCSALNQQFGVYPNAQECAALLLRDKDPRVVSPALHILRQHFEVMTEASVLLKELLSHPEPEVKLAATYTLETYFLVIPNAVDLVDILVQDAIPEVRGRAIEIFSRYALQFDDPISWLKNHVHDSDSEVRSVIGGVFRTKLFSLFGWDAVRDVMTSGPSEMTQNLMILQFQWHGKVPDPLVHIERGLRSPDNTVRWWAAEALARKFPWGGGGIPLVALIIEDEDAEVRGKARQIVEWVVKYWK